jgi:L-iditol 2-dehydrogenase
MRAAVYRGGSSLEPEDLPIPEIQAGELLVRVRACGICGTDLKKIQYGLVDPPKVFGHEMAGEVVAVGAGATSVWDIGDRVALNHHVPCERTDCFYCSRGAYAQCPVYKKTGTTAGFEPAGGGFAQYVRVMDWCAGRGVLRIPNEIGFDEATFIEPLNTCLKGIRTAGIRNKDTVIVIGQGPIGLLFTMLARNIGAKVVAADPVAYRRRQAVAYGAVAAIDPDSHGANAQLLESIAYLTEGRGADLAIVAVAATQAIMGALQCVRPAGKVLLFAQTRLRDLFEVDAGEICMREKMLIGSYSSDIRLQQEAADMIFNRSIDVRELVTHRFSLDRISEAIGIAAGAGSCENSLKVLVTP